jgi:predicted dehydrogenase/nucleoside-diphosphate-sugar epimerase
MRKLKLAVIGCGAVTKLSHLPAIARSEDVELVALVDKDLARARHLLEEFSIEAAVFDDYRQVFDRVEAAIVALPNALHAPVTIDLLKHGVHVLVEKPMALHSQDCEAMIATATNHERILAVGMARRFCDSSKFVKQALERQILGKINRLDLREGRIFDWQVASDAMFRKSMAGGGVLLDIGVHALDQLLWWFRDCELVSYCDDAEGGLEADCEIRLRFQSGLTGIVELSRTRNLRNSCVIAGDRGTLTVDTSFGHVVHLALSGEDDAFSGRVTPMDSKDQPVQQAFRDQLKNFACAIREGSPLVVPGSEGMRAVQLIESCYARRRPFAAWGQETRRQLSTIGPVNLSDKRVLVTGGTGFIGNRLVEQLVLDCNARVRVLVRNYSRAAGIARFPVEMVQGDVVNAADIARATEGCEIVIHCAYGHTGSEEEQKTVIVEGTRNVLEAAARCKVERVVHLSTLMVYGIPKDGDFDETAPRKPMGFVYADSKIAAERLAFEYHQKRGVPVCIIQPTTVYGPYSTWHTVAVLESLKSTRVMLIDGGEGACNPVYVDDVVNALLLAATQKAAVGEAFLISGEHAITWRDFYNEYERMLGSACLVSMSAEEAKKYYIRQQRSRGLLGESIAILRDDYSIRERILETPEMRLCRNMARFIFPRALWEAVKERVSGSNHVADDRQPPPALESKPMPAVPLPMIRFFAAKGTVRIDKAKRLLGYEPAFDLRAGMNRTEQWARWANLLGSTERK